MKNTAKLLCLALCATLPLGYASAAWSEITPKKNVVKVKAKKHNKVRAKKSATPRISAKKSVSSNKITAKPQATLPMETASQALVITPAVAVAPVLAAVQPVVAPATSAPVNPYLAQPNAAVKSVNPYMPQPPMPWPEQKVSAPTVNPYLASAAQTPPVVPGNPYMAVSDATPASTIKLASAASTINPYLASAPSSPSDMPAAAPAQIVTPAAPPQIVQHSVQAAPAALAASPSKAASPGFLASLDPKQGLSDLFGSVRNKIPLLNDQDLLPTVKKVYPTGEKPLVIISFKCPTEMIGITPPPMKALHELINFGFDGINKTNMLSFNLQQVCN